MPSSSDCAQHQFDQLSHTLLHATADGIVAAKSGRLSKASISPLSKGQSPVKKCNLAQAMFAEGLRKQALAFAYDVLQKAKNDAEAALRYFALMMLDLDGRETPRPTVVALDAWASLEGVHGEFDKLRHRGRAGPAGRWVVSPKHQLAAAAIGLKVGEDFTVKAAFGTHATSRVAEIKHKYLHALHDVMENFQTQFPDARGFYTLKMKEGDVQPALDEIKRVSESNRKLAELYLFCRWVWWRPGSGATPSASPTMSDRWIMTSTAAPARQGNATPLMRWSNNIVRRARFWTPTRRGR